MSEWLYEYRERRDGITIPTIWVAIVLSALLHILMLGRWLPQVRLPSLDEPLTGETSRSLVVQLAPPAQRAAPPPSPAQPPQPAPAQHSAPPAVAARPRPAPSPPVMALNKPAPDVPAPPPVPAPSPTPAPPAPTGDLSSYIEAQRRARMAAAPPSLFSPSAGRAPAPPVEDDAARGDRAIAANLGLNRAPSYGPDATKRGGGIFQIQRMGYSDAEFLFYGWNKDIRRNTTQMIEVRKGDNSDLRLAVVRKMIAIIREYETEDFLWESPRLGRNVMLSARQRDNAGLEDFMLMEFFRTTQVQR